MRIDDPAQLRDARDVLPFGANYHVATSQARCASGIREDLGHEHSTRYAEDVAERLAIDLGELRSRNGNEAGISLTENHQRTIARRHWRATEHHDSSWPPVR